MKWWLISDEDVRVIMAALGAPTHEANDFNCEDWPPGNGCDGCKGDELRAKGLHALHSGLHNTESVPDDFKEKLSIDPAEILPTPQDHMALARVLGTMEDAPEDPEEGETK